MVKTVVVLAGWIGSMWIPTEPVLVGYMQFARAVSLLFLLYQAVLMLAVAYVINEFVKDKCGYTAMLVFTILFTCGNITWTVFQFLNFSACGYNVAF